MITKFRVVKITRISGEERWVVQALFQRWLTGKLIWKYYADYNVDRMYSRNIDDAMGYHSEEEAVKKMYGMIRRESQDVMDTEVVTTYSRNSEGKFYEETRH